MVSQLSADETENGGLFADIDWKSSIWEPAVDSGFQFQKRLLFSDPPD